MVFKKTILKVLLGQFFIVSDYLAVVIISKFEICFIENLVLPAVLCGYRNHYELFADVEYFVMKLSGVLLVLLSFVLAAVIYISLSQNIAAKYGEIIMITIATYTFGKITVAVVKAVKQHKNPSPLLSVIRTISCAEAAASILTLQRSMLVSFGSMETGQIRAMNAITGAVVCLFVLTLGISMIIKGIRKG